MLTLTPIVHQTATPPNASFLTVSALLTVPGSQAALSQLTCPK